MESPSQNVDTNIAGVRIISFHLSLRRHDKLYNQTNQVPLNLISFQKPEIGSPVLEIPRKVFV